jgi:hypothetical protein|tara:strand:- start:208 stop:669 length:462 start_codon:yes stop_codon:yes gene_type:complete
MNIIGIDPGKSGAIAIWNGGIDRIVKCPLNVINMADEIRKIKDKRNTIAYVERVHAFPTDARSSAFKFGMNYGQWLGILGAMRIKTILVTPQTWMKYFKDKLKIKLPKEKPKRKRKLKEIASQYTDKSVTLYNSDAILISVYGFIQETKRKEK